MREPVDHADPAPRHLAQAVGVRGLVRPARFHRPGHRKVELLDDTREVSSPVAVQWQGFQSPRVRRLSEAGRLIVIGRGKDVDDEIGGIPDFVERPDRSAYRPLILRERRLLGQRGCCGRTTEIIEVRS